MNDYKVNTFIDSTAAGITLRAKHSCKSDEKIITIKLSNGSVPAIVKKTSWDKLKDKFLSLIHVS